MLLRQASRQSGIAYRPHEGARSVEESSCSLAFLPATLLIPPRRPSRTHSNQRMKAEDEENIKMIAEFKLPQHSRHLLRTFRRKFDDPWPSTGEHFATFSLPILAVASRESRAGSIRVKRCKCGKIVLSLMSFPDVGEKRLLSLPDLIVSLLFGR